MTGAARSFTNVFNPPNPNRGLDDIIRAQQQQTQQRAKELEQQQQAVAQEAAAVDAKVSEAEKKSTAAKHGSSGSGQTILTGPLGAKGYGSEANLRRKTLLGG